METLPPDVSDTTRRYPRTMEEDFGPYQRLSPIYVMARPDPVTATLVAYCTMLTAVFLSCFFLL